MRVRMSPISPVECSCLFHGHCRSVTKLYLMQNNLLKCLTMFRPPRTQKKRKINTSVVSFSSTPVPQGFHIHIQPKQSWTGKLGTSMNSFGNQSQLHLFFTCFDGGIPGPICLHHGGGSGAQSNRNPDRVFHDSLSVTAPFPRDSLSLQPCGLFQHGSTQLEDLAGRHAWTAWSGMNICSWWYTHTHTFQPSPADTMNMFIHWGKKKRVKISEQTSSTGNEK